MSATRLSPFHPNLPGIYQHVAQNFDELEFLVMADTDQTLKGIVEHREGDSDSEKEEEESDGEAEGEKGDTDNES